MMRADFSIYYYKLGEGRKKYLPTGVCSLKRGESDETK